MKMTRVYMTFKNNGVVKLPELSKLLDNCYRGKAQLFFADTEMLQVVLLKEAIHESVKCCLESYGCQLVELSYGVDLTDQVRTLFGQGLKGAEVATTLRDDGHHILDIREGLDQAFQDPAFYVCIEPSSDSSTQVLRVSATPVLSSELENVHTEPIEFRRQLVPTAV